MTEPPFRLGIVMSDFALGGTERVTLRLAAEWARRGVEVEIFCGDPAGPQQALVGDGVRVVAAAPRIRRGLGARRRLGRAARAHFAAHPVDAIYVPGNYHWRLVPALLPLKRDRAVRIIVQVSSALEKLQRRGWRQRLFERRMRRLLDRADAIVTLADEASDLARRILGRDDIVTLPLPALPDRSPPPVPSPAGAPLVVAIGRLVAQKDFATLIDAFGRVRQREARLEIVGAGPLEKSLRARIARAGLDDRIALVGAVADTRAALDRARLLVLSSRHEGYGAVIIEALAAGRPVVATNCTPAARELLADPAFGRVVPVGDPAALAAAIDTMLGSSPPDAAVLAHSVEPFRIGPIAAAYLRLAGCEATPP